MIGAVSAYIKNIIGLIIMTAFAETILPNGNFKKYIRLITGLLIVAAITEPAVKLVFGKGFDFKIEGFYGQESTEGQKTLIDNIYMEETEKAVGRLGKDLGVEILETEADGEKIDVLIKPPHVCVQGFNEEECEECSEAAKKTEDAIKNIYGMEVNVEIQRG